MAKRPTIEQRLERVRALQHEESSDVLRHELERTLSDSSNFVVEAAAKIVDEQELTGFEPFLLDAFERLLIDPIKTDKGCVAKTAIVEALNRLDFDDAEFYLRGMRYTQPEPAWDGSEDAAAHLRGACAYGLVKSGQLGFVPIMTALVDLLADSCKTARVHAALAIANTGRGEAIPVLRLKVLTGDSKFEVMGACFFGLLQLDAEKSISLVAAQFTNNDIDVALEAVASLGEIRQSDATKVLIDTWKRPHRREMHVPLLISIGLSNQPAAIDFLLQLIKDNCADSEDAVRSLAPNRFYGDLRNRVGIAVRATKNQRLLAIFDEEFAE